MKALTLFIWETKYHQDQHSQERSTVLRLIDHLATHFHKTEILITTNPKPNSTQHVFQFTFTPAKCQPM